MGLQQFERRLERLVEGVFARAFRSQLRPVELGRRLTREMDQARTVGVRGALVAPNVFTIALSPDDRESFASFEEALVKELAEAAREHAHDEAYRFLGPVEVSLVTDDSLVTGRFMVAGEVRAAPGGSPAGSLVLPDGNRITLSDDPVTIGRLPECEIPLSDPNVSRRHAEVRRQDDDIVVVDLGSTNGTRVNGAGVTTRVLLDGDEITVGTTAIRFEAS
jgi:hypothetical protein